MKKALIAVVFTVSICLSFFAGSYFRDQKNSELREQRCHQMVKFAIDKMKKNRYDTGYMEALISNTYAAYQYSDDGELSAALHSLWNALIFNGENLIGKENALIRALEDTDAQSIEDIAMSMRTNN